MIKTPDTIIIILVLDCSDNFEHKYIEKKIIRGTPKPNNMYFGIIFFYIIFLTL